MKQFRARNFVMAADRVRPGGRTTRDVDDASGRRRASATFRDFRQGSLSAINFASCRALRCRRGSVWSDAEKGVPPSDGLRNPRLPALPVKVKKKKKRKKRKEMSMSMSSSFGTEQGVSLPQPDVLRACEGFAWNVGFYHVLIYAPGRDSLRSILLATTDQEAHYFLENVIGCDFCEGNHR
ncbi:unnamed protein product [Notodromas monacha]|uniref:Uncharacterized protein n=1 Tax=Notodromas monacha TaxID=399045 RepID=A0A7R9BET4_9CRUS|nr:unnamed protein product [Notodromas monacha]CAG0913341.1 unnamed protein product [Notodromas monacha]